MRIRNRVLLDKFVQKHADSIKAIQKFIDIVEEAEWQNLNGIKKRFQFGGLRYQRAICI
jgi:mRNA-degrading endonuclease HigB of HigAB toxin-antitoxin module